MLWLVSLSGCKRLPNPEADSFVRTMRALDRAQRPTGRDLPVERFIAWQSRRDTNIATANELTMELRALAGETDRIVRRLDEITTRTAIEQKIVFAYRDAHEQARLGLEALLDQRMLGTETDTREAEQQVISALDAIRQARKARVQVNAGYKDRTKS